ncbi:uncharacterized protein E5676_scaffold202G002040 [Cucumis melo var. makuwa]|uniref:Uncharacterized protein n=1 Tax=Cucumis melo var. makuwa TaxID=1194695 RepID=A0A5A7SHT6_CUCMM|nr:uncharacterized protein E6C27_scaffold541G00390 [Cucumis melo var. makuwa]TYK07472.1 uncharacterized protein E5676_scaffold202G002040 [Cucumis melo var. makuwa]
MSSLSHPLFILLPTAVSPVTSLNPDPRSPPLDASLGFLFRGGSLSRTSQLPKSNHQIDQLKRAVELRDQMLLSMQQKLDDLCNQVNPVKDQSGTENDFEKEC